MISSMFSKPDLLKTFLPLSDGGKAFLEVMLVNPKTSKCEGRGFFNDIDFLLESCTSLVGRYNFCLSNFAFAQEQIPSRASRNQFDRTLMDAGMQETARAHSLTALFFFKPELIREMSTQAGNGDQFLNIVYQIDGILSRLGVKNYSLDYFLTGMVARFHPFAALQQRALGKTHLAAVTRRLMESMEKEMTPQELKHFALGSSLTGKVWDPLPGLPGRFAGDSLDAIIVNSSGALQGGGGEAFFASLIEEVVEGKASRSRFEGDKAQAVEPYSPTQGLSQSWTDDSVFPVQTRLASTGSGFEAVKDFGSEKTDYGVDKLDKGKESSKDLVGYFQACSQGRWHWPLYSFAFNRVHQGVTAGEVVLLHCAPFAADIGFHYLLQCAEGYAKEGAGQLVIFSKTRLAGDIALSSLCRHYKANPLAAKQPGKFPDAAGLAQVHASLFPSPPQVPPCGPGETVASIQRYIEHDYLLKQKKTGNPLMPLVLIVDGLDDFSEAGEAETRLRLAQLKLKLREINGSLWVTQSRDPGAPAPRVGLGVADHLLTLDHDGSMGGLGPEGALAGMAVPEPGEWEADFRLDLPMGRLMQEISLVKVRFQEHGSHRPFQSQFVYYRPISLFREVNAPQTHAAAAPAAAASAILARSAPPGDASAVAPRTGASSGAAPNP